MKITILVLITLIIHAALSVKQMKKVKPKKSVYPTTKLAPLRRPASFFVDVRGLMKSIAASNGYKSFDKCHIVPWKFIQEMVAKHWAKRISQSQMELFINALSSIHYDAAYYKSARADDKKKLSALVKDYQKRALDALKKGDSRELLKLLFNMPSNLCPGDSSLNRSIQNNFDPPRKQTIFGRRSADATAKAKVLFQKYSRLGLTAIQHPITPTSIKSSDKPPMYTYSDFVKIT